MVVRPHRPWRGWLLHGCVLVGVLALGSVLVLGGERALWAELERLRAERERLAGKLERATAELDELRERVTQLTRSEQVARSANDRLRSTLKRRQEQLAELRSDLDFYRSLVRSGGENRGLDVYDLGLVPTSSPRVYHYRLTLMQDLEKARVITGRVRISIDGIADDQPKRLDWSALRPQDGSSELEYSFKYFQELKGELMVPEDFSPNEVHVRLIPGDRRRHDVVRRAFAWQEVTDTGDSANVRQRQDQG